jgi:spore maturation protein CgeB
MTSTEPIQKGHDPSSSVHQNALEKLFKSIEPIPSYGRRIDEKLPVVAVILDEFSTACFEPDVNIVPIGTQDIAAALDHFIPDFLLCESAWRGNNYAWQHQIATGSGAKPKLLELLKECQKRNIPTVFWNKEDPPHFDDFIESAKHFDFIFTTEDSVIPRYIEACGHENVGVLPFAAQPRIHAPERVSGHRLGNVVFAGQYFSHKFPERREQMEYLFPAAAKYGFSIFSREASGDSRYRFPDEYEKFVRGSLPYDQMLLAYRQFKIFLNVNSVPSSSTMCARRIFELSAAKTVVVSSPTPAITNFYQDNEVLTAGSEDAASDLLMEQLASVDLRQRTAHRAWRRTLRHHTYGDRIQHIRQTIQRAGDPHDSTASSAQAIDVKPAVSRGPETQYVAHVLARTNEGLNRLLDQISSQSVVPTSIKLHSLDGEYSLDLRASGSSIPRDSLEEMTALATDIPLDGRNYCQYAVVFVEDIKYSRHYAEDLCLSFKHGDFVLVGKRVTAEDVVDIKQTDGEEWPEDMTTDSVKAFAWASRSKEVTVRMIERSKGSPLGLIDVAGPAYATDRFNAVPCSVLHSINGLSWEV